MRILVTADPELPVPPLHYGGIERIVAQLIDELRSRGNTVALVAHQASAVETDATFAWPRATSRGVRSVMSNTVALGAAVGKFNPDIVHSFSRLAFLGPLLAKGLPKVMSFQRKPTRTTVAAAARIGRETLTFTGCSEFIAAQGRACGGRWMAIPNFVDPNRMRFADAVPPDAPAVFLSRIEKIKGTHVAIEIAKRAGTRLLIAGNHSSDAAAAEYWKTEIEPEIGRNGIEYVGPVDDEQKSSLLSSARAMLVPIAWDEPFGIVFVEALACGTPVISCPRGALPEIVRPGIDGFLVNTVGQAVDALRAIPSLDRSACRRRVDESFSVAKVASRYEELYSTMLTRVER